MVKQIKAAQFSVKLRVIKYYWSGYGCTTITRDRKIAESRVKRWIQAYHAFGVKGQEK